jgi:hypothetical protein
MTMKEDATETLAYKSTACRIFLWTASRPEPRLSFLAFAL